MIFAIVWWKVDNIMIAYEMNSVFSTVIMYFIYFLVCYYLILRPVFFNGNEIITQNSEQKIQNMEEIVLESYDLINRGEKTKKHVLSTLIEKGLSENEASIVYLNAFLMFMRIVKKTILTYFLLGIASVSSSIGAWTRMDELTKMDELTRMNDPNSWSLMIATVLTVGIFFIVCGWRLLSFSLRWKNNGTR
jgi:hypothetical protein